MIPSVLALVAHPDDESLIAGGTLALAARAGAVVTIVSLTRGELGPIADPALASRESLPSVRTRELANAGRILGATLIACLDLADGELPWADRDITVAGLLELLDDRPPEVILTFGEDGLYGHPDHTAAGEIAHQLAMDFDPPAEVLESVWSPETASALVSAARARGLPYSLWGVAPEAFGVDRAPVLTVDVRPVLAQKLAALRAHRTQLPADHLLAGIPADLVESHLGVERWAGASATKLERILSSGA